MTAFLVDVGSFAAKAFLVALYLGGVAVAVMMLLSRRRAPEAHDEGVLFARRLDTHYRAMSDAIRQLRMSEQEFKELMRSRKDVDAPERTVYVADFDGDLGASAVRDFRRVVTAVVGAASEGDSVVVRVRSPGGTVPGYGLAAAQMERLRNAGLRVVATVDTVAASGGYMMAVVSDELVAAPFAIVGSIGVYLPVPNVNELLKKHGVEFEEMTSGKYKRTVSVLGEITDDGRQKTQEMLDDTHVLFKEHVAAHRPKVVIEEVSTGEYWYGRQALDVGLVDRLATSDEVLLDEARTARLVQVTIRHDTGLRSRLSNLLGVMSRSRPL